MKAKLSGLSGAVIGSVMIVAVLLIVASGSALTTAGAARMLGGQGGGRPTPKPIRTRRIKRSSTRTRATAPVSNASKSNNAAPKHNAIADRDAINSNRKARTITNASQGSSNANSRPPEIIPPPFKPGANRNTLIMADPADKSKIVPVLPNSWPILTTPLQPTPNPDLDILLPKDFRKLESESEGRRILSSMRQDPFSEPEKFLSTTGAFSEISGKRKVFVNNSGEYRDKITARLRAYGGLEIVKTAREAEFAVWYDDWAREERFKNMSGPLGIWEPETVKDVTGGTLIITIRDPSQHIPRIIWRKDDTDGGWVRRGDAHDKLVKRFISELKKLRAEK